MPSINEFTKLFDVRGILYFLRVQNSTTGETDALMIFEPMGRSGPAIYFFCLRPSSLASSLVSEDLIAFDHRV